MTKTKLQHTLKAARQQAELTQVGLANLVGASQSAIAAMESLKNEINPTYKTLQGWADACELDLVVTFVKRKAAASKKKK